MTACIRLSGSESSASNLEILSDYKFTDSLELAYYCVASGIRADRSLLISGNQSMVSDSVFGWTSNLTGDDASISNCKFNSLDLNGNRHRVVGVNSQYGDLRVYGDDCVVLACRMATFAFDAGADSTRYGASDGTLTDNGTNTIYLDNVDGETFEGPIEVTYLVAAYNARSEIRAVADFVCDGTADEVEINAVLALLGSTEAGGRIILTEGTFTLSNVLEFPSGKSVTIQGAGMLATYLETEDYAPMSSSSADAVIHSQNSSLTLRDLYVYHMVAPENSHVKHTIHSWDRLTMDHVYVYADWDDEPASGAEPAVYAEGAPTEITGCQIEAWVNGALDVDSSFSAQGRIRDNYIYSRHNDYGWDLNPTVSIKGNFILFDNNVVEANSEAATGVFQDTEAGVYCNLGFSTVSNNMVLMASEDHGAAILNDMGSDNAFIGNWTQYGEYGIQMRDDSEAVTITGNTIYSSGLVGILVEGLASDYTQPENMTISGNLTWDMYGPSLKINLTPHQDNVGKICNIVVTGNSFTKDGGSYGDVGECLIKNARGIIFSNNGLVDNTVKLEGCDQPQVSGNTFRNYKADTDYPSGITADLTLTSCIRPHVHGNSFIASHVADDWGLIALAGTTDGAFVHGNMYAGHDVSHDADYRDYGLIIGASVTDTLERDNDWRLCVLGGLDDSGSGTDDGVDVEVLVFAQTGALVDGFGTIRVYTKTDRAIVGCFASVSGVPVSNPAVFDVHMDNVTIYTTQANRPDVAASAYEGDVAVPDVTAWLAGSFLTVDVDTASSATDLIMTIQYTEA